MFGKNWNRLTCFEHDKLREWQKCRVLLNCLGLCILSVNRYSVDVFVGWENMETTHTGKQ